jgi:hypothetical protein
MQTHQVELFCLKNLFSDSLTNDDGEEVSTKKLKITCKK